MHDAPGPVAHAPTALGYAVKTQASAIEQICLTDYGEDRGTGAPLTSAGATIIRNNRFIAQITDAAELGSLELTAWTSDGATFTTRDAAGSISTAILFVKFPDNVPLSAKVVTVPESWDGELGFHNFTEPGFHFYDCFVIGTVLSAVNTRATDSTRSRWSHDRPRNHECRSDETCNQSLSEVAWQHGGILAVAEQFGPPWETAQTARI